jgi:hypothetical protein
MSATADSTFADPQQTIADCGAKCAGCCSALRGALAHLAATAEVLKIMSSFVHSLRLALILAGGKGFED